MRVLDSFQAVAGPLPERDESPPRIRVIGESTHPGYTQQTIRYEALPEDPIPAYPLIADGWGKRPAVLALHPADTLGKGIPAGLSERPNRGYAHELALRGLVVLAADYVYMGDSQGDPYELGYASGTMKGNYNHIRGVDSLASLPSVDAGRIGVIGHSSRGHNALFVALFDKRFRALVTSCEFNAFAKYKNGYLSGWSSKKYMPRIAAVYDKEPALMPFEFTEVLGAVAPRAVFISAPKPRLEIQSVRSQGPPALRPPGLRENLLRRRSIGRHVSWLRP